MGGRGRRLFPPAIFEFFMQKPSTVEACNTLACVETITISNSGYGKKVTKIVTLDVIPSKFHIYARGDDSSHVWVNGTKVLKAGPNCGGSILSGSVNVDLSLLKIGDNEIIFQVVDDCGYSSGGSATITITY